MRAPQALLVVSLALAACQTGELHPGEYDVFDWLDTAAFDTGAPDTADTADTSKPGTDTADTADSDDTAVDTSDTSDTSDTAGTGDTGVDTGVDTGLDTADTGYDDYEDDGTGDAPDDLPPGEQDLLDEVASIPIALEGFVLDDLGDPIPGVTVTASDLAVVSGSDGFWRFDALSRHNVLVGFEGAGWRPHHVPAWLYRPLDVEEVTLQSVVLTPDDPGTVRFVFGGDVAFAGGFMDPARAESADRVPSDSDEALISPADPLPGARAVMAGVAPYLLDADYPVVNLEGAVTDDPATPHPEKSYHRFMLPDTLEALTELGVSYVSLGNDHVYDYLDAGLDDTRFYLDEAGLSYSGAGADRTEAWAPWRGSVGGTPYSFVSATSNTGSWLSTTYVADDTKGGAANLGTIADLRGAVLGERESGRVPIGLFHMGRLYTDTPSGPARLYAAEAAEAGAALVIGHHPHWVQGFGEVDGVPVAWSLGDLALPLDRLDSVIGMLVVADLQGDEVLGLQGVPILGESWVPRPVCGEVGDHAMRLVAQRSDLPAFGWANRIEVWPAGVVETRTVNRRVHVGPRGWAVVDLRADLLPGESLARVEGPVDVRLGRDLMLFGNVEDQDVDDDDMEVPYWGVSGASRFACATGARRGVVGLCSTRSASNTGPSVISFRNRIRVEGDADDVPNKDVTVFGYVRGSESGPLAVLARYKASRGDLIFGQDTVWTHPGGTFDWRAFSADIPVPADIPGGTEETNPRAVRVFFSQDPPASGWGLVNWDDLAVISWQPVMDATNGLSVPTPHARDFVRVEAPPGSYTLEIVLERYERF